MEADKDIKFVAVNTQDGPLYDKPVLFRTQPSYYVLGVEPTTYPNLNALFNVFDGEAEAAALEEGQIAIYKLERVKHPKLLARALRQHLRERED